MDGSGRGQCLALAFITSIQVKGQKKTRERERESRWRKGIENVYSRAHELVTRLLQASSHPPPPPPREPSWEGMKIERGERLWCFIYLFTL